jgi:hypothetical protein
VRRQKMALDKQQSPANEAALTLVDIEELRKILGAEADIASYFNPAPIGGVPTEPPIRVPGRPGGSNRYHTTGCPTWFD